MKDSKGLLVGIFTAVLLLAPSRSSAQVPLPPLPQGIPLGWWRFDDTNWLTVFSDPPLSFTNLDLVPSWNGNALQIDSTNAACLRYNVRETDGWTNLAITNGTIRFWFKPNWNSAGLEDGTGPGTWGRLIEIGSFGTNSSCLSLFLDPGGTNLYFSAQTNTGATTNYLAGPASFDSNTWTLVTVTYSLTNTSLYVNDQLAATGPGLSLWPDAVTLSNGFCVGSDGAGLAQARGQFEDLWTLNYPLNAAGVSNYYAAFASLANPPLMEGGGVGQNQMESGGYNLNELDSLLNDTNSLWLEILTGTNQYNTNVTKVTILLHNTVPDVAYQLLSATTMTNADNGWIQEQMLLGAPDTNLTVTTVSTTNRPTLVFRAIAATLDTDGSGMPDWWQMLRFGHLGVNPYDDPDGDGWTNIREYRNSTGPNTFDTPPPPINVVARFGDSHTNIIITWEYGGGPIDHYEILLEGGWGLDSVGDGTFAYTNTLESDFPDPFIEVPYSQERYVIRACFTNGSYADSLPAGLYNSTFNAEAVALRGPGGEIYLALASPPPGLTEIRLFWLDWFEYVTHSVSIPATNLVHGCVRVPIEEWEGYIPGNAFYCQLLGSYGAIGESRWMNVYSSEEYGFVPRLVEKRLMERFITRLS